MTRLILALAVIASSGLAAPTFAETLHMVDPALRLEMPSGWNMKIRGDAITFKAPGKKGQISVTPVKTEKSGARFGGLITIVTKQMKDAKIRKPASQRVKHFEATSQAVVGKMKKRDVLMVATLIKTHRKMSIILLYTGLRGKPGDATVKVFNKLVQSLRHVPPKKR
ncbi:MAG: hypothetical protein KC502_23205 [Myxococcales bacterium]|nr:hypothetical protein [Myxococcales bacterium]